MSLAIAVWALMCPMTQAHATEAPASKVQTASNVDGSSLRIITTATKNNSVQITDVLFSKGSAKPMLKIGQVVQLVGENRRALIILTDWAKEGTHAIETVDECGAGPNCSGMMYLIDTKREKVVEFFKTSGVEVSLLGGYLIEKARDSCCAWVTDVYKLNATHTQVASSPEFSVQVEFDVDSKKSKQVHCTFSKETDKGRIVIKPPAKVFLQICRQYGPIFSLK